LWGMERKSQKRRSKRSGERLMRNSLAQRNWAGRLKDERGTTTCKMTRVHRKMSLGMALL
jgi:hypothetical protein